MKKQTLIIIYFLFSITLFSQNSDISYKDNKEDSINYLEIKNAKKINDLEKLMKFKSDSLNKELLYYRVKEDFYAASLSDQGNRFTVILSGILTLFALISFGAFKYELLKIRNETNNILKKNKDEIDEYKKELDNTNKGLKGTKANLYTSISIHLEKENNFLNAFIYYLLASKEHGQIAETNIKTKQLDNLNDKNYFDTCIINLDSASKKLKKIKISTDEEDLKKELDYIRKTIDEIFILNNEVVKSKVIEIRQDFNLLVLNIN